MSLNDLSRTISETMGERGLLNSRQLLQLVRRNSFHTCCIALFKAQRECPQKFIFVDRCERLNLGPPFFNWFLLKKMTVFCEKLRIVICVFKSIRCFMTAVPLKFWINSKECLCIRILSLCTKGKLKFSYASMIKPTYPQMM